MQLLINRNKFVDILSFAQANDYTMLSIIFLLSTLSSPLSAGKTSTLRSICSEVHWSVSSIPVIFGENVTLICQTTDEKDLCTPCRKIWTGGPELSLLSLNGHPTDNSKYLPTLTKNRFEITIRNFTEEDLNQKYICTIDENSCSKILTIDMFKILKEDNTEDNTLTFTTRRSISSTEIVVIAVFVMLAIGVIFIISLRTSIIRDPVRKVECYDFICSKKPLPTSNSQNIGTNQFGHSSNRKNPETAVDEKEKGKVCTRHGYTSCEKEECFSERPLNSEE